MVAAAAAPERSPKAATPPTADVFELARLRSSTISSSATKESFEYDLSSSALDFGTTAPMMVVLLDGAPPTAGGGAPVAACFFVPAKIAFNGSSVFSGTIPSISSIFFDAAALADNPVVPPNDDPFPLMLKGSNAVGATPRAPPSPSDAPSPPDELSLLPATPPEILLPLVALLVPLVASEVTFEDDASTSPTAFPSSLLPPGTPAAPLAAGATLCAVSCVFLTMASTTFAAQDFTPLFTEVKIVAPGNAICAVFAADAFTATTQPTRTLGHPPTPFTAELLPKVQIWILSSWSWESGGVLRGWVEYTCMTSTSKPRASSVDLHSSFCWAEQRSRIRGP